MLNCQIKLIIWRPLSDVCANPMKGQYIYLLLVLDFDDYATKWRHCRVRITLSRKETNISASQERAHYLDNWLELFYWLNSNKTRRDWAYNSKILNIVYMCDNIVYNNISKMEVDSKLTFMQGCFISLQKTVGRLVAIEKGRRMFLIQKVGSLFPAFLHNLWSIYIFFLIWTISFQHLTSRKT